MSSSLSWLGMRLSMESDYPNMPLRSSSLMYLLPTIIRAGLPNQMSTRSNPNLHVQTSQPMQYQLQRGRSEMLWRKSLLKIFSASSKVYRNGPRCDSKTRVLAWRGSYVVQLESLIQACSSVPPEMRMTAKLRSLGISYHLFAAQAISRCHGCFSGLPQILTVTGNGRFCFPFPESLGEYCPAITLLSTTGSLQ